MALLQTPEAVFGHLAPDFELRGTDDRLYSLADIRKENGFVVAFICNHCPYVQAIVTQMVQDAKALQESGFGFVAIMPNDTKAYPQDDFAHMQSFARDHGFSFPYLIDETQETAKAYGAVCTPDFFGFDSQGRLCYRGRLNESNPSKPPSDSTRRELLEAMQRVAKGQDPQSIDQKPSMGCSIKWR